MEYYVYYHDFNKRTIEKWNIFNHVSFTKDVGKLLKENITKEEFAERLKGKLFYYFGCKCEYEVMIVDWPCHINKKELDRLNYEYERYNTKYGHYPLRINVAPEAAEKVDIYSQVWNNKNLFIDYVWSYKEKEND